jgi:hypothetical protein
MIALLVAACAVSAAALGAPAYPRAAERACAAQQASEARLEPDDVDDPGQLLRFFRGLAAAQRTLTARLGVLRPPAAARPTFRRLVADEGAVVPLLDEAARLLSRGVSPGAVERRVYPRITALGRRIGSEARRLGLRACAAP